jgi:hypothetical protein
MLKKTSQLKMLIASMSIKKHILLKTKSAEKHSAESSSRSSKLPTIAETQPTALYLESWM